VYGSQQAWEDAALFGRYRPSSWEKTLFSGEVKEDFFQRLIVYTELKHNTSSNYLKAP